MSDDELMIRGAQLLKVRVIAPKEALRAMIDAEYPEYCEEIGISTELVGDPEVTGFVITLPASFEPIDGEYVERQAREVLPVAVPVRVRLRPPEDPEPTCPHCGDPGCAGAVYDPDDCPEAP